MPIDNKTEIKQIVRAALLIAALFGLAVIVRVFALK
jgi:hypothetical protein